MSGSQACWVPIGARGAAHRGSRRIAPAAARLARERPARRPLPTIKQGRKRDGVRYAFMFRWSNGRTRAFDVNYPHRLQMTDDEKAGMKERQAAAAAGASKFKCPPKRTRDATERACK